MDPAEHLDELLVCRLSERRKAAQPCTMVIFGASGDLTARKLIPALYHLYAEKLLPQPFRVVGVARRPKSSDSWRAELREDLRRFSRTKPIDSGTWEEFAKNLIYCEGDINQPETYRTLQKQLDSFGHDSLRANLLFYLAVQPSQFATVSTFLHECGLLQKETGGNSFQRLIVEKPFGHDLASAQKLNADLTRVAHENQIYRIDHYLGKETVQNILMFRFSNAIFE